MGSLTPHERSPQVSNSLFGWIGEFYNISDTYVLNHHSLDGFLFLRFLKICVISCVIGCLITWPVLFPVHITGGGGLSQLDVLTMANIKNKWRYWADAGCAIIFFSYILIMITRESIYYINLRQAYLLSPLYAERLSSRTVLFTSVYVSPCTSSRQILTEDIAPKTICMLRGCRPCLAHRSAVSGSPVTAKI